MDRRALLKLSTMAGGALIFPIFQHFSGKTAFQKKAENQGYIQLRLNDLEILLLSDGYISLSNPQPIFAPGVDAQHVRNVLKKIYLPENKLESAINVMLIKQADQIILIDTGSGYHFGEKGGWLLSNLKSAGIEASDITDVFITHAHIDHIGGILTKEKNLVYPKAHYYIAKKEYDFWMSAHPDFSQSKSPQNPAESISFAKEVLQSIKSNLTQFYHGEILFSCIKTELAEGHTPGHTIFTIFGENKTIKHIVDVIHTPLLIAQPDWGTEWDVDFAKGVATRKHILTNSYQDRTLVMTTHLPWPGLGYIDKKDDGYQWVPFSYFTPNEIIL